MYLFSYSEHNRLTCATAHEAGENYVYFKNVHCIYSISIIYLQSIIYYILINIINASSEIKYTTTTVDRNTIQKIVPYAYTSLCCAGCDPSHTHKSVYQTFKCIATAAGNEILLIDCTSASSMGSECAQRLQSRGVSPQPLPLCRCGCT